MTVRTLLAATVGSLLSTSLYAACSFSTPVELTVSGSTTKAPGESLQIDYCFSSGSAIDMYAAVALPDGTFLYLTATGSAPTFSATAAPFKSNAPAQTGTVSNLLTLTLPSSLTKGTYTFYAVGVPVGGSPTNSAAWLGKTYASKAITIGSSTTTTPTTRPTGAFFYQTVNPTTSIVKAGATSDGKNMSTYNVEVGYAKATTSSLGDPVWSRLSNGKWTMTGWAMDDKVHGSGGNGMLYYEGSCPQVVESKVKVLTASTASGCDSKMNPNMSKTSQIFDADGTNYILHQSGAEIYLTRLTDSTRGGSDLNNICMLSTPVSKLADLKWGEATKVISKTLSGGLLLSDVAIARRKDKTWVMFVKGIASDSGCVALSVCELCARGVYRSTSTDLITWTKPEKVVSQASVPDAATYADGSVWLYYQNFNEVCSKNDNKYGDRAPISGMYENSDLSMSSSINVKFSNEDFETNTSLHYPTNGNPIAIPDTAAMDALDACMGTTPK